jgi:hypothetical protein
LKTPRRSCKLLRVRQATSGDRRGESSLTALQYTEVFESQGGLEHCSNPLCDWRGHQNVLRRERRPAADAMWTMARRLRTGRLLIGLWTRGRLIYLRGRRSVDQTRRGRTSARSRPLICRPMYGGTRRRTVDGGTRWQNAGPDRAMYRGPRFVRLARAIEAIHKQCECTEQLVSSG